MPAELWVLLVSIIFAVIGYLLSRKDAQQASDITLLWEKHDDDAKRLQDLELDIAKHHYLKAELDPKFEQLTIYFKAGMETLGAKVDKLTDTLIHKGNGQ